MSQSTSFFILLLADSSFVGSDCLVYLKPSALVEDASVVVLIGAVIAIVIAIVIAAKFIIAISIGEIFS